MIRGRLAARSRAKELGAGVGRIAERAPKGSVAHPREYALIVASVTVLVSFGLVMVYSASSAKAGFDFTLRTLGIGVVGGVTACLLMRRVSLTEVRRFAPLVMLIALAMLVAVLIPGVGHSVNGARRWLGVGPVTFQASEIAKVALVVFLADRLLKFQSSMGSIGETLRMTMPALLLTVALVAIEPDMGTAIVCLVTGLMIYWLAGAPRHVLGPIVGGFIVIGLGFALVNPERTARLTAFLNPDADPLGAGFQSLQGQIAIGSGGVTGVGPGQSVQKVFYLPEAHTDFILAVIGEELGLIAIVGLLACFGTLMWAGLRVSVLAGDPYAKLIAAGMTALITCQALLNICVVLGIAPLTGVPLPFISFGPTNLVVLLCAVGILLNVAAGGGSAVRSVGRRSDRDDPDAGTDRGRGNRRSRGSGTERRGRAAG